MPIPKTNFSKRKKSSQKQLYCVGRRHFFNANTINEYEKVNPKTNKVVKFRKRKCDLCGRNKTMKFSKEMTLTACPKFEQKRQCKHGDFSALSKTAWWYLKNKGDLLKLHGKHSNNKCSCQKMTIFTSHQFQMEGSGFRSELQKLFEGTSSARSKFRKPPVKKEGPFICRAVGA